LAARFILQRLLPQSEQHHVGDGVPMREGRGGRRYVAHRAVGTLEEHGTSVGPRLVGQQRNENRRVLVDETTLEVPVRRIQWGRVELRLHGEVALRPDGVLHRLAEAVQTLKKLSAGLCICGVDDVDLRAGLAIIARCETQIYAELPRRVRDELCVELDRVLDLRGRKVDVS